MRALTSFFNSRRLPQCGAAIIANLIAIAYGTVPAWTSPSIPILRSNSTTISETITDEHETWLGSLTYLSALVTSPLYSYINQNMGRKIAGYLSGAPLIIGWLFIIFGNSIVYFYIARVLMGVSLGGVHVFLTMYIGEISEDKIRGALGTVRGLTTDIGILFTYCIGPYLSIPALGIACITLPILYMVTFFWLPESPMFLLGKGKEKEALDAYIWLRRGDKELAEEEMKKLRLVVQSRTQKVSLKEMLSVRGTRNALLITLAICIVTQLSGMNVVFSYTSRIFQMSGSSISPDIATIIVGVVNVSGSLGALLVADLAGRRVILITTLIFQGVFLGGLGMYLYLKQLGVDVTVAGILPVICLSLYCFCLVAGVATVGLVVISETFRPEARGLATNVASTSTWILAFICTKCHHMLEYEIGLYGCFGVYAGISVAGALFMYIRLPETKNRSLESILRELNGETLIEKLSIEGNKLKGNNSRN